MTFQRFIVVACVLFHLSGGIQDALGEGPAPTPKARLTRLVLLGQGPDGHPRETHEFRAGLRILKKCLDRIDQLDVTIVDVVEPWREGPSLIDHADGVVIFLAEGARWVQRDPERLAALRRLAERRGGISGLHWGIGTREAQPIADYVALVGACHGGPDRKYATLEVRTEIAAAEHPVLRVVDPLAVEDEFYYRLKFVTKEAGGELTPLLRVPIAGESHPVAWAWERPNEGRSFGFTGLHFHRNWQYDAYRRLVVQGVAWTMQVPIPEGGLDVEINPDDLQLP